MSIVIDDLDGVEKLEGAVNRARNLAGLVSETRIIAFGDTIRYQPSVVGCSPCKKLQVAGVLGGKQRGITKHLTGHTTPRRRNLCNDWMITLCNWFGNLSHATHTGLGGSRGKNRSSCSTSSCDLLGAPKFRLAKESYWTDTGLFAHLRHPPP